MFNFDAASDTSAADPKLSECGQVCHMEVKTKDYIFHPYQKR